MSNISNNLILSGEKAFYNSNNYTQNTERELSFKASPVTVYSCKLENRIFRIVKEIFSYIFLPIIVYRGLHALIGRMIIQKSNNRKIDLKEIEANNWKIKLITMEVDGIKFQAVIMGKPNTFNNGRWTLHSGGIKETIHSTLNYDLFREKFLKKLNSNAILFNAPDVLMGASPNRSAYIKAYKAMLQFLEDKIQAKEIILDGYSLGGGIQGEGLDGHVFKKNVKYVCIKNRTFSCLQSAVKEKTRWRFLGFLIYLFGWNIDTASSSKKLKQKEIIIQASYAQSSELNSSLTLRQLKNDGVITPKSSLAASLNKDKNKTFFALNNKHKHSSSLSDNEISSLTKLVNKLLLQQETA